MIAPPYECPTGEHGARDLPTALAVYAESTPMPRSPIASAWTLTPSFKRRSMTPVQLLPSANAPWIRTTRVLPCYCPS